MVKLDMFVFHICFSGNNHDDMLLAKVESVYTGSSDPSSSLVRIHLPRNGFI